MLIKQNVNNDVTKDSPIRSLFRPVQPIQPVQPVQPFFMKNKLETACVLVKVSGNRDFACFSLSQSQHIYQHEIETTE